MGFVRDFANFHDFEIDLPRKQKLVCGKNPSGDPPKKAPVYSHEQSERVLAWLPPVSVANSERSFTSVSFTQRQDVTLAGSYER